jgi:hypothetical protein
MLGIKKKFWLAFVFLGILKVTKVVTWSWWIIALPIIVPYAFLLFVLVLVGLAAVISHKL